VAAALLVQAGCVMCSVLAWVPSLACSGSMNIYYSAAVNHRRLMYLVHLCSVAAVVLGLSFGAYRHYRSLTGALKTVEKLGTRRMCEDIVDIVSM